ncbi:cadherin repeat domain-containing protein [Vibrio vulnificus]|uniref:cadherin repeat domain-containing protein n=1 Tax=Vibrio vulnificus TaxID=672 RepID=UPI00073567CD|nr:cadherin repeat domain-containing protein [Vibrio vulnificus]PNM97150.1 cadherin repeat domain-containing protein [Vibrio vulnificus]
MHRRSTRRQQHRDRRVGEHLNSVATFTASDLDDQDNVTYEITSGNDNNYFAIDSDGKVTLTDAAWRRSTAMRRDLTSLTLA